jgi:nitrogen-specific signal transduction histidine kinase
MNSYLRKGRSLLGMVIAIAITKTHDGIIQIRSEFGEGPIFTIKIPSIFLLKHFIIIS